MDVNSKFVQSSLHGVLTAGSKYEGFKIPNPEYQGNNGEEQFLNGTPAYMRTVSQSMMGTGLAPSRTTNPLLEKMIGEMAKNKSVSYVGESDGAVYKHNNIEYEFVENVPSLGVRPVAIVNDLSEDESEIYLERGRELNKRIPEPALSVGFAFDIPNQLSSYSFSQTQSYYPGMSEQAKITQDMISAPSKRAYVCTALIECLLMLTDPTRGVSIKGRFGLARAILSEDDASNRNINPTSGIDAKNTNAMSDHVFGRAFDIDAIDSFSNFGKSKEHYAASLTYVLERLNALPMQLIPDLIIISPDVARDIGVMEGYDSESTALKTMYPNLKYVNFESAPEHDNNIHISFSHNRAGQYIGSPGWKTVSNSQSSTSNSGVPVNTEEDTSKAKEKGYTNYKSGTSSNLEINEMFILLTKEGPFNEEVAAVLCAIAARESSTNPGSFNGKCSETATEWQGDYSVGMFQFNLIGLMNKARNFSGSVPLYYDGSSVNPQMILASDLAYTPRKAAGMGSKCHWEKNDRASK
jgi:hypothetical protein